MNRQEKVKYLKGLIHGKDEPLRIFIIERDEGQVRMISNGITVVMSLAEYELYESRDKNMVHIDFKDAM